MSFRRSMLVLSVRIRNKKKRRPLGGQGIRDSPGQEDGPAHCHVPLLAEYCIVKFSTFGKGIVTVVWLAV